MLNDSTKEVKSDHWRHCERAITIIVQECCTLGRVGQIFLLWRAEHMVFAAPTLSDVAESEVTDACV